jgi:hypothetical protein
MKKNVGDTDRILRFVAGIALLSLLFILEGSARYVGLVGIVMIATAAMRFCPAYPLLGINTCCSKDGENKGGSCCGGGACGKAEEPVAESEKADSEEDKAA